MIEADVPCLPAERCRLQREAPSVITGKDGGDVGRVDFQGRNVGSKRGDGLLIAEDAAGVDKRALCVA